MTSYAQPHHVERPAVIIVVRLNIVCPAALLTQHRGWCWHSTSPNLRPDQQSRPDFLGLPILGIPNLSHIPPVVLAACDWIPYRHLRRVWPSRALLRCDLGHQADHNPHSMSQLRPILVSQSPVAFAGCCRRVSAAKVVTNFMTFTRLKLVDSTCQAGICSRLASSSAMKIRRSSGTSSGCSPSFSIALSRRMTHSSTSRFINGRAIPHISEETRVAHGKFPYRTTSRPGTGSDVDPEMPSTRNSVSLKAQIEPP